MASITSLQLLLCHNDRLVEPRLIRKFPNHLTAAAFVEKLRHFFPAGRPVLTLELADLQRPRALVADVQRSYGITKRCFKILGPLQARNTKAHYIWRLPAQLPSF